VEPPAGRLAVGDVVSVPDGRRGRVVAERLIASNGACRYSVTLDGGGTLELFDFELKKLADR
jgi:hypothetical protein